MKKFLLICLSSFVCTTSNAFYHEEDEITGEDPAVETVSGETESSEEGDKSSIEIGSESDETIKDSENDSTDQYSIIDDNSDEETDTEGNDQNNSNDENNEISDVQNGIDENNGMIINQESDEEEEIFDSELFDPLSEGGNAGELLSCLAPENNSKKAKLFARAASEPLTYAWFDEIVNPALASGQTSVNISEYNIAFNDTNKNKIIALALKFKIMHPEYFYLSRYGYSWSSSGIFTSINMVFDSAYYDASKINAFQSVCNSILAGVDSSMSDVEKALYLHDYLVTHNDYDTTYSKYNAYNALVNQTSVCQGYSLAYLYLMKQAGVETGYVTSDTMNHAWNYVKIDGVTYFVDNTFDDPISSGAPCYRMYCGHSHFLVNCSTLSSDHESTDWINEDGVNVRYLYNDTINNRFWKNMSLAVPHIGREWLIDDHAGQSHTYNVETGETHTVTWNASEASSYYSAFRGLAASQKHFFIASNRYIYRLDLEDYTATLFASLTDEEWETGTIYGMQTVNNGDTQQLYVDIATGFSKTEYKSTKIIDIPFASIIRIDVSGPGSVSPSAVHYSSQVSEYTIRNEIRTGLITGSALTPETILESKCTFSIEDDAGGYIVFYSDHASPRVIRVKNLSEDMNITLREIGDASLDGSIDVADLSVASSYILSASKVIDESTDSSDYDRNGVIDVADLSSISNRILRGG